MLFVAFALQNIMFYVISPKSSLFFGGRNSNDVGWEIQVSSDAAKALLFIYALLACSALALFVNLWGRRTGLKWDSVTIADKLALLRASDILNDFDGLGTMDKKTINRLGV